MNIIKIASIAIGHLKKQASGFSSSGAPSSTTSSGSNTNILKKKTSNAGVGTYQDVGKKGNIYTEIANRYPAGTVAHTIGQYGLLQMLDLANKQADPTQTISGLDQRSIRRMQVNQAIRQFASRASGAEKDALYEHFMACGDYNAKTKKLTGKLPAVGFRYPMSPLMQNFTRNYSPSRFRQLMQISNTISKADTPKSLTFVNGGNTAPA